MRKDELISIFRKFKENKISENQLLNFFENYPYEDISFAKIDHHRSIRWGFPEVIFCQNKTPDQVLKIALKITDRKENLLATRAGENHFKAVKKKIPDAVYDKTAQTILCKKKKIKQISGKILIVTAGTSDLPVAAESYNTGEMLGLDMKMISDVGVAGIHRIMDHRKELQSAAIIIVIAGMEGALASVIAGLVQIPVVAVPSSVGYGASFNGLTPLLGMLNSCVPGIAVMNIDNGFGAAFLAFKILNTLDKLKSSD